MVGLLLWSVKQTVESVRSKINLSYRIFAAMSLCVTRSISIDQIADRSRALMSCPITELLSSEVPSAAGDNLGADRTRGWSSNPNG